MDGSIRKKLIASSAAYILGMRPKIEINGTPKQVKRFKEVLEASKDLYYVLQEGSNHVVEKTLQKMFLPNPSKNTKNMIFEIFNILKFLRFWI